ACGRTTRTGPGTRWRSMPCWTKRSGSGHSAIIARNRSRSPSPMDGRCPRSEADSSTSPFPPLNGGRHREHALEPHGLLPKPDSSRRLAGIESGAGGRCAHGRTNARAERPHYRDKLKADYARPSKDELVARFRARGLTGPFWEL